MKRFAVIAPGRVPGPSETESEGCVHRTMAYLQSISNKAVCQFGLPLASAPPAPEGSAFRSKKPIPQSEGTHSSPNPALPAPTASSPIPQARIEF